MTRRFRKALVHFIADCEECNFSTDDYKSGPRAAARHAAKTGHRIQGDMGYAFWHNREMGDGEGRGDPQ